MHQTPLSTFVRFCAALLTVAGTLEAQEPLDLVPIQYRAPTLVVEASVNGTKPLLFAFDTGSTTCLIDARVARRLGITAAPRPGVATPRGVVIAGFARARTLAVGRAEARDLELVIRDLSPLSQGLGVEVAGILGYTWMEQFVFEIDYRAATLTLWPRSVELTPQADQLPLPLEIFSARGFTGASLFVPAILEGTHRCLAEIDTGTDYGVLGRDIAARLGVTLQPIATAQQGGGLPTHTVTQLELAGRTFTNVRFVFDPRRGADANPYAQCVIGNEQLKEFVLTVDIPRRRAFFRRLP